MFSVKIKYSLFVHCARPFLFCILYSITFIPPIHFDVGRQFTHLVYVRHFGIILILFQWRESKYRSCQRTCDDKTEFVANSLTANMYTVRCTISGDSERIFFGACDLSLRAMHWAFNGNTANFHHFPTTNESSFCWTCAHITCIVHTPSLIASKTCYVHLYSSTLEKTGENIVDTTTCTIR